MDGDKAKTYEVVIIGGGPAGLTAGIYAGRKRMRSAIVSPFLGGQVMWTARAGDTTGFYLMSGADLIERFNEQMEQFPIQQFIGKNVSRVRKEGERFAVEIKEAETLSSRCVIVATGRRPRRLGVPGEGKLVGKGVSYCATCDGPFFKDKDVVVVGGGNSAVGVVLDLVKFARSVHLVTQELTADRGLLERVSKQAEVNILENHQVTEILGEEKVEGIKLAPKEGGGESEMSLDGVFIEIGFAPNSETVEDLAELNAEKEILVDRSCATSAEGMFAAGDVTNVPHKQAIVACGEGAKAALSAVEFLKFRSGTEHESGMRTVL